MTHFTSLTARGGTSNHWTERSTRHPVHFVDVKNFAKGKSTGAFKGQNIDNLGTNKNHQQEDPAVVDSKSK